MEKNYSNKDFKVVNIVNAKQAYQYIKHGLKPLDIFVDEVTGKLIYVFNRLESQELFTKWVNYELH